jgi:hypothetical protein
LSIRPGHHGNLFGNPEQVTAMMKHIVGQYHSKVVSSEAVLSFFGNASNILCVPGGALPSGKPDIAVKGIESGELSIRSRAGQHVEQNAGPGAHLQNRSCGLMF